MDVDPRAETAEGIRLARKAIELGKDDAAALSGGGFGIAFLGGELDAGLALTDRAILLNPNFVGGWHASGWIRSYIGDPETAILHLAHAMRLSPVDFQMWQFWMASSLATRCAGRFNESSLWAEKILQEGPDFVPALISYAVSSALGGGIERRKRPCPGRCESTRNFAFQHANFVRPSSAGRPDQLLQGGTVGGNAGISSDDWFKIQRMGSFRWQMTRQAFKLGSP